MVKEHPLLKFSEIERVNYLSIVAALAYADKEFHDKEKTTLMKCCDELHISDKGRGAIFSAVFNTGDEEKNLLAERLNDLKNSDLKFTLISDLFIMAHADGVSVVQEETFINSFAEKIGVSKEQVKVIKEVQENLAKLAGIPESSDQYKEMLKDAAANLAAAGIPILAIAFSGSVFGLSGAGIVSGLAALGAFVGGSMLAGIVIVIPALALGSYKLARKILDSIWK